MWNWKIRHPHLRSLVTAVLIPYFFTIRTFNARHFDDFPEAGRAARNICLI